MAEYITLLEVLKKKKKTLPKPASAPPSNPFVVFGDGTLTLDVRNGTIGVTSSWSHNQQVADALNEHIQRLLESHGGKDNIDQRLRRVLQEKANIIKELDQYTISLKDKIADLEKRNEELTEALKNKVTNAKFRNLEV